MPVVETYSKKLIRFLLGSSQFRDTNGLLQLSFIHYYVRDTNLKGEPIIAYSYNRIIETSNLARPSCSNDDFDTKKIQYSDR